MGREHCRRAWEAEAVEDGRLSNADRASFERHAATCEACAREARGLASLRRTVQEVKRQPPDALALRRTRGALLLQAHVQRAGLHGPRRRIGAALVVAIVLGGAFAWAAVEHSYARLTGPGAGVPPAASQSADALSVHHAPVAARADRGTAIGEPWSAPSPTSSGMPVPSTMNSAQAGPPGGNRHVRPRGPPRPAPGSNGGEGPHPRAPYGDLFAAAVAAFKGDRYTQADALFASFVDRFPDDPRCEDAAFLRAMSHAREGDPAGAAALARAYLRSFPKGLRRKEAERLAGTP